MFLQFLRIGNENNWVQIWHHHHSLFNFSNSPKERARMRKNIFIKLLAKNKGVKQLLKEFSELSGWFLDQGKTEWILTLPSGLLEHSLNGRKSQFLPLQNSCLRRCCLSDFEVLFVSVSSSLQRSSRGSSVKTEMMAITQTIRILALVRDHDGLDVNDPAWASIFMLCLQLAVLLWGLWNI